MLTHVGFGVLKQQHPRDPDAGPRTVFWTSDKHLLPTNVTSIEKGSSVVTETVWSPLPSSCVQPTAIIICPSVGDHICGVLFHWPVICMWKTHQMDKHHSEIQHSLKPNCSDTLGRFNIQKNKHVVTCVAFMITSPFGGDYASFISDLYPTRSWSVKKNQDGRFNLLVRPAIIAWTHNVGFTLFLSTLL